MTRDELIEKYATGAHAARRHNPPIEVYRQHMREFADEIEALANPDPWAGLPTVYMHSSQAAEFMKDAVHSPAFTFKDQYNGHPYKIDDRCPKRGVYVRRHDGEGAFEEFRG